MISSFGAKIMKRNHIIALVIAAVLMGVYIPTAIFVIQPNKLHSVLANHEEYTNSKGFYAKGSPYGNNIDNSPEALREREREWNVFSALVHGTEIILLNVLFGWVPALIAKRKGCSFGLWWFYGVMLFIVALPHSLLIKADVQAIAKKKQEAEQRRKKVAEYVVQCLETIVEKIGFFIGYIVYGGKIAMKHKETGIMKTGFYGFSWTTFFFGFFPALFRSDFIAFIAGVVITIPIGLVTAGIGGFFIGPIWAFRYNKYYTLKLVERGYVFDGSDGDNATAALALGIAIK